MSDPTRLAPEVSLGEAVDALARDALVAFPTETVWGLAADARSHLAVARLATWKRRDPAQPISVLVSGPAALPALGVEVTASLDALAQHFWPGPLTLVLRARSSFAAGIARDDGGLGLRCSSHPDARALAAACEAAGLGPPTATSLNRSGEPAARTREEARALCAGEGAPCFYPGTSAAGGARGTHAAGGVRGTHAAGGARGTHAAGGSRGSGAADDSGASSVLDLCGARPRLLRAGAISREALAEVLGCELTT